MPVLKDNEQAEETNWSPHEQKGLELLGAVGKHLALG